MEAEFKRRVLLEVIAASARDARAAEKGGADRLEVCSALPLGGLTPSLGTICQIQDSCNLPVMAMLRPREGGMAYSGLDVDTMLADAELFLAEGVQGLVFGFLTPDARLHEAHCKRLLRLVETCGRKVDTVFHRAFDICANSEQVLEQLIDLGVTRILTSGRARTAIEGVQQIGRWVDQAGGRIEILPGGGIELPEVGEIVKQTGVDQLHIYAARREVDSSPLTNPSIRFAAYQLSEETEISVLDSKAVARLRSSLDS